MNDATPIFIGDVVACLHGCGILLQYLKSEQL